MASKDESGDSKIIAAVHPSSILRATDDARDYEYRYFVDDLRIVANELSNDKRKPAHK